MTQPLDRSARLPQIGELDTATGEFWRENVFEMGAGTDNLSAYEPNRLFLNLDGKQFLDASFGSGCDIDSDSRSVVAADFNRDGAPDLLVGSVGGGPMRLFANRFPDSHHSVRLHLVGTQSNRFGIGSRAIIQAGGRTMIRDLFPANGCMGQAPAELLVGVGLAERITRLEIRWPSGQSQMFTDLPVDGVLTITEGQQDFSFAEHGKASNGRADAGRTAFASINDPRLLAANAWAMAEDERVLGITFGEESRAYPLRYMQLHQLCHDEVLGTPLLISYCPPSASGAAFERRLVGKQRTLTLSFDVAGMLETVGYTVLRDRQTQSLWNPLTGQCLKGTLRGSRLKRVPLLSTNWAHWLNLNPSTKTLAPILADYPDLPLDTSRSGSKYVSNVRKSCSPDTLGIGVRGSTQQLFLPLEAIAKVKGGIVTGRLDGRKIVVFYDPRYGAAQCFYAIAGDDPATELAFSRSPTSPGRYVARDGSVFDILGRCQSGPLSDRQLVPILDASVVRWYAWSLTFPDTHVVKSK